MPVVSDNANLMESRENGCECIDFAKGTEKMRKLEKMLSDWFEQGLIESDQKSAIAKFEAGRSVGGWMIYSFIALGASVISIGVNH
jgi:hypothetical protein